jgi:KDO2-lipid IV(A) lauroyltransferase
MADARFSDFIHPRYWLTWLGLGFMRVVSWLPLPVIAMLGGALGMLLYMLHAPRRRVVHVNLRLCFPQLSRRARARLARRHFRAFGQTLLDIGIAWWSPEARLRRYTQFRGREHYDKALREHKNIILFAPHFIGLEMGWILFSRERPMVTVYRHVKNAVMDWIAYRGRTRFGGSVIDLRQGFRPVIKAMQIGRPLYYLPDQDLGQRRSVFAPFFGIQTATVPALGRLAEMTDAVVIPCITRQLSWGRGYEIEFRPPLKNFPSNDPVADTTRMNREIEEAVREQPEQYFWLHKRFKTRPQGEKDFYKRD